MLPWQQQLAESVTNLSELLSLLDLDAQMLSTNPLAEQHFSLRVPRDFIHRMQRGNPQDPLLIQVLPQTQELLQQTGFSKDPLNEKAATKIPGLLHKYHGRVLLITTAGCAINCRYCFRRHFPYQENLLSSNQLNNIIHYINNDANISEVILSGGDPLILKDESLFKIITQLSTISHLKYLRIHTRFPIMIPDRVTDSLVTMLNETRLRVTFVLHCNHPQELDSSVAKAIEKLQTRNIKLFNQTVLLKKINDCAETLIELSHQLYAIGVVPYYLHLLDPVQGTTHFSVSEAEGKVIMQQLRERLPGYLVPQFVKEVAGQPHKIPIF